MTASTWPDLPNLAWNVALQEKSPRRWFRFSLRTMFVVVTALWRWLGWEMSIVRARQALLAKVKGKPFVQITTAGAWEKHLTQGGWKGDAPREIRLVRRWLGDEAIQEIACGRGHHTLSQEEFAQLAKTFPEAKVHEFEVLFEPCHPGCFPRGTSVETSVGTRNIETIRPGDELIAILPTGKEMSVPVQSIFATTNRLWEIETQAGSLLTTQTQPLCVAIDGTVEAGQLQPGDAILCRIGGKLQPVAITGVNQTERVEKVFNLVLGNCEVFIAGGYLARSKPPAEVPTGR